MLPRSVAAPRPALLATRAALLPRPPFHTRGRGIGGTSVRDDFSKHLRLAVVSDHRHRHRWSSAESSRASERRSRRLLLAALVGGVWLAFQAADGDSDVFAEEEPDRMPFVELHTQHLYPRRLTDLPGVPCLRLLGASHRTMLMVWTVYSVAVYADLNNPALQDCVRAAPAPGADPSALLSQVFGSKHPFDCSLRITSYRVIQKNHLQTSLHHKLLQLLPEHEEQITRFLDMLPATLQPGESIDVVWRADGRMGMRSREGYKEMSGASQLGAAFFSIYTYSKNPIMLADARGQVAKALYERAHRPVS